MATAKRTSRSRTQDRSRLAGGQAHEVGYEARKTGTTRSEVKRAIKKAGSNMRKAVEAVLPGAKRSAKKGGAKKAGAKKSSARKTSAKRGAGKTGGAKKSARRSTGRKTGARKGTARKTRK